jgi:hypothetical protein
MKAACVLPWWRTEPSGGRRGFHYISRELARLGVEAVTVGLPYEHEAIGDTVIHHDEWEPDADTALITPEGCWVGQAGVYYKKWIEDYDHGPVVCYCQNTGMGDHHSVQPWVTHYWGLGKSHNTVMREKFGIPESMPISPLFLPTDTTVWKPGNKRIRGSIFYFARRGEAVLETVARAAGSRPVFRVEGATPKEVRRLMAQADIFVLASECEGQSCALNEAMSMELACVSWPACGIYDVLEHGLTGLIVEQDYVLGLIDAVRSLQEEPAAARALGKNARAWVNEIL